MQLFNTPAYFVSRVLTALCTGEFILTAIATLIAYIITTLYYTITNRQHTVNPNKDFILITGCSSGIGLCTVCHLADKGYTVFAGIRKETDKKNFSEYLNNNYSPKQASITNERIIPIILDISKELDRKNAVTTIQEYLQQHGQTRLIGVIHNAGITLQAPIESMPEDDIRKQFEINSISPVVLSQQFLPLLRQATSKQRTARLIFVASVAAHLTTPDVGVYSATKHAIRSLASCFRQELQQFHIDVAMVSPGAVQSDLRSKGQNMQGESDDKASKEDSTPKLNISSKSPLEPSVAQQYKASHAAVQRSYDTMSDSAANPMVVAAKIESALRDTNPLSEYLAAKEAHFLPMLRGLPDRIFDRLALMEWNKAR